MRRSLLFIILAPLSVLAAHPPAPSPRLPRDNLLLFRDAHGQIRNVESLSDWQRRHTEILAGIYHVMGRWPDAEKRCPLDTTATEEIDCGQFVRRSITYASEPGCRVPTYLLIPKSALSEAKARRPAVLCLHPTDNSAGHGVVVGLGAGRYPPYANELAERGFVVLAPAYPLLAKYQPDLKVLGWDSGSLKAAWDNSRGLDLLESLPFVEPGVFAAIGHSLGGHNAIFTAVFDDRIRAVVSCCGFDSFLDYYGGNLANWQTGKGWTQLRYMPKLADYRDRLADIPFDFHELMGALAPRHVLVIAPKKDDNFRADSVDRIAAAARPVHRLHGCPERLRVEHPDCGHDFPPTMRDTAYAFLETALRPGGIRVGVFEVDATPPIGSPLAYDPTKAIDAPLSCRGLVLLGAGKPIVLCAVDWIGVGNEAHRHFRERLAAAAGTTADRVAVHALHQHDAPWCDFEMGDLLSAHGLRGSQVDAGFARNVMDRTAAALKDAIARATPVTHIGTASAKVERVASNRRILGPDGKVRAVRYSATKDAALQAEPEGVIDPDLKLITLFDGDKPLVALTSYATHPQSYYRTGRANPDFPGLARNSRQKQTGVPHIHFTGAAGNVAAGKYNDGSPALRQVLADRIEAAMVSAWNSLRKRPIAASDVDWSSLSVALPPALHLDEAQLLAKVRDSKLQPAQRSLAAAAIVFHRRSRAGAKIDLGCLHLGDARWLSMPGELFVEYQLAAQQLRPDLFVMMSAYGDYGPSYIGTAIAYDQGGYETQPTSSFVAPQVERVLLDAIRTLLNAHH
jgi:hypothetical protein